MVMDVSVSLHAKDHHPSNLNPDAAVMTRKFLAASCGL